MQTDWKTVRLADVCHFQNGYAFKNTDYVEEGNGAFEIFRMGHIRKGGGFNPDGKKALVPAEQAAKLQRFLLNEGDILMCMTDMKANVALLGHTARMPVTGRYLVNQRVGRITVKNPDALDGRFLYYYSNTSYYIDWLRSHANSGVQVNLSTDAIINSPIALPPLPLQQRIAGILSAYDELIENCRRRIKILEQMARGLYREWFVNFRFPNHATTPMVDSPLGRIPKEWGVTTLGAVTTKIGSGATPRGGKASYKSEGIALIRSLNIYDYRFEFSDLAFIDERQAEELDSVRVQESDILLNITGASVARCALVPSYILPARVNQHVTIVRVDPSKINPFYLLDAINSDNRKAQLLTLAQGGATREALTKDTVSGFEVVLPPSALVRRYGDVAGDLHKQREVLQRQLQNLRKTRDLLLPRLMSGQINVN